MRPHQTNFCPQPHLQVGLPLGIKADCCEAVSKEITLTAWNDSSRRHRVKNSTYFFFSFFHFSNHIMRSDFTDEAGGEQTSETCLRSHGKKAVWLGCTPRLETVLVIQCPPTPPWGPRYAPRSCPLEPRPPAALSSGCLPSLADWKRQQKTGKEKRSLSV